MSTRRRRVWCGGRSPTSCELEQLPAVLLGRTQAVDAADRGDDDGVAAGEQRAVAEWRSRSISSLIDESFSM
jgi:hypothetical protein